MSDIFLGWDVGAWNCDRNPESRDALCALESRDGAPVVLGSPWRGNLREALVSHEGPELVRVLLELAGAPMETRHLTVAIDTPLAWPQRMVELLAQGRIVDVPGKADCNPYLFRRQELALFNQGCRPLSVVRDMIGSQSTKGIHFLRRATLAAVDVGVWRDDARTIAAIETYPAAAVRDVEIARLSSQLLADLLGRERRRRNASWQGDVRDAITCAIVAWFHRTTITRLARPEANADAGEGWIWLPQDVIGSTREA